MIINNYSNFYKSNYPLPKCPNKYPIFKNAINKSVLDCTLSQSKDKLFCNGDKEYHYLISVLKYFRKRDRSLSGEVLNCRSTIEKNYVFLGGINDPYKTTPLRFMGLIPYCGFSDISIDINNFLKYSQDGYLPTIQPGTKLKNRKYLIDTDSETIVKFIKCLNYSLSKIDEQYGIYSGLVYRGGLFSPEGKQFYSTSKEIVPYAQVDSQSSHELQFHIIKTTKGHKIYKFQEEYYKPEGIAKNDTEREVLLSPTNYKEIKDKNLYRNEINDFALKIMNYLKGRNKDFAISDIENKIHLWEEIL